MLGLLLIYFIGKAYYQLADQHGRSKWGFAILGVVAYYFGSFAVQIAMFFYFETNRGIDYVDDNAFVIGLIGIPMGLLTCWITYTLLKRQWNAKPVSNVDADVLDQELEG